jgi:hypothetical protein
MIEKGRNYAVLSRKLELIVEYLAGDATNFMATAVTAILLIAGQVWAERVLILAIAILQ